MRVFLCGKLGYILCMDIYNFDWIEYDISIFLKMVWSFILFLVLKFGFIRECFYFEKGVIINMFISIFYRIIILIF